SAAFGTPAEQAERRPSGNRVVSFLRASWAELQRVQWPDRQQVAQATGVVLGFVIITGIFLGVADYVAGKIINAIIYERGHVSLVRRQHIFRTREQGQTEP